MDLLTPLAAFPSSPTGCAQPIEVEGQEEHGGLEWPTSFLGSQSRITGRTPSLPSTWRIDGSDVDGRRFYAVPGFAVGKPPLRIDVYLPPMEDYSRPLRSLLKPDALLHTSKETLFSLPITQHVLRALDHWSAQQLGFQKQYLSKPFGSQILITQVSASLDEMAEGMHLIPNHAVEQAMQSIESLSRMWAGELPESAWPPTLNWEELRFHTQLHEAITLVEIPSRGVVGQMMVFKSLIRDQRYMYNELKMLLTVSPHPNIVPRPAYIVTKRGRFGGKRGICGFVMEYFHIGSLTHHLSGAKADPQPDMALDQRFRWSRQITEAFIHINTTHPAGFYPDLKPDNIVLRPSESEPGMLDVVLLDFEQRGGWYSWSPPEILYAEYLEALASGLEQREEYQHTYDEVLDLLEAYIPGWAPSMQKDGYRNAIGGFSAPWRMLLQQRKEHGARDLERAQVFMLGKLLWCIFEGEPLVRCGIDRELLSENCGEEEIPLRFPEFRRTPKELRDLVRRCTQGAPEWTEEKRPFVMVQDGKLVAVGEANGRSVQEVCRRHWTAEVQRAMRFIRKRIQLRRFEVEGAAEGSCLRPGLVEVLAELEKMETVWAMTKGRQMTSPS